MAEKISKDRVDDQRINEKYPSKEAEIILFNLERYRSPEIYGFFRPVVKPYPVAS